MTRRTKEELQEIAGEVIEDILGALDEEDVRASVASFGYVLSAEEIDDVLDEIDHVELSMRFGGLR